MEKLSLLTHEMKNKEIIGSTNINISFLTHKSELCSAECVYFCLDGTKVDGHDYVTDAYARGCRAFVCERKLDDLPLDACQIIVPSSREAMSLMASVFYNHPEIKMKMIGITGTNGKTTTSYMMKAIFEDAGAKVGVIGTNGIVIDNQILANGLTTPDPIDLYSALDQMVKKDIEYCIMEVSAHAIDLHKIDGIMFNVCIFTNLTQDHLDYFETMERYADVKKSLFNDKHTLLGIANIDDKTGAEIFTDSNIPVLSLSFKLPASINATSPIIKNNKMFFEANLSGCPIDIELNMLGDFNAMNAICAIAGTSIFGIPLNNVQHGLKNMPVVAGRFNTIDLKEHGKAIIDYAHTPDGLSNILGATRKICDGKIISVFGCGGNRDKGKRPIMGEISGDKADFTVLTSDNPRYENPQQIIYEIEEGISSKTSNYVSIPDRFYAIKTAIELASKNDIVVISGKGAEPYIDACGIKKPYSDYETVETILSGLEPTL